jgi:hypothetical protein
VAKALTVSQLGIAQGSDTADDRSLAALARKVCNQRHQFLAGALGTYWNPKPIDHAIEDFDEPVVARKVIVGLPHPHHRLFGF